jgi:hypothetical protein
MRVNNELERMWKEVVVAEFNLGLLFWHLPVSRPNTCQKIYRLAKFARREIVS